VDEATKRLYIEEINQLIKERQKYISKNYPIIREIYKSSYDGDTELNPLRCEICICLIFGLHQAAITLTNHLVEKHLKVALIYKNANFDVEGKDVVDKMVKALAKPTEDYSFNDLSQNINAACSQGIITKEDKKKLNEIRESFRNAYCHADALKTHTDKAIPLTSAKFTKDGIEMGPTSMGKIAELPFLQGFAQVAHAEVNANPYFQFVDSLIRRTRSKVFPDT